MSGKSFKAARADHTKTIDFDIEGVPLKAVSKLSAGAILDIAELSGGKEIPPAKIKGMILTFMEDALLPPSYATFLELLKSKDIIIEIDNLIEIVMWLVAEYTERPTGEPSSTTSLPTLSGSGSTAGSLHAASMFSRPEPRLTSVPPVSST